MARDFESDAWLDWDALDGMWSRGHADDLQVAGLANQARHSMGTRVQR
jgi:hypothetical protein